MRLDDHFDRIVCLCHDKRAGQWTILEELAQYGATAQRFLAGDGKTLSETYDYVDESPPDVTRVAPWNYARCVLQIVGRAKKDGVKRLLFLEDDAVLTDLFASLFETSIKQADAIGWDALFVGGNHVNASHIVKHSENVIQPNYSLDLHAIAYASTIFDAVLRMGECKHHTFDGAFAGLQRQYKVLAFHPSLITQKANFSLNELKMVNRGANHWLRP